MKLKINGDLHSRPLHDLKARELKCQFTAK